MRFADKICFVVNGERKFDPKTGKYSQDDNKEIIKMANITDTSQETVNFAFGGYKKGVLTVRVKSPINLLKIDNIKVVGGLYASNKNYSIVDSRKLRNKLTFLIEEVV